MPSLGFMIPGGPLQCIRGDDEAMPCRESMSQSQRSYLRMGQVFRLWTLRPHQAGSFKVAAISFCARLSFTNGDLSFQPWASTFSLLLRLFKYATTTPTLLAQDSLLAR
jgi:hypothetical protein